MRYEPGCFSFKNRRTSGNGLRYFASRPSAGNPMAMMRGVMYVKSKSNPSCWYRTIFMETIPRTTDAMATTQEGNNREHHGIARAWPSASVCDGRLSHIPLDQRGGSPSLVHQAQRCGPGPDDAPHRLANEIRRMVVMAICCTICLFV